MFTCLALSCNYCGSSQLQFCHHNSMEFHSPCCQIHSNLWHLKKYLKPIFILPVLCPHPKNCHHWPSDLGSSVLQLCTLQIYVLLIFHRIPFRWYNLNIICRAHGVNRAPGISVFEFHSQSKRERERDLRQLRRNGGVCLTSYGIIVNNAEQLATDVNGRDFVWVRNNM